MAKLQRGGTLQRSQPPKLRRGGSWPALAVLFTACLEKEHQRGLTVGGAFGCWSREVPGGQSGLAAAVPGLPKVAVAPALPSGGSSICSRLSCSGELPRDWKSGGEALPVATTADGGVAGQVQGCLGSEVCWGHWGCEAGVISEGSVGWPGKWGWPGRKAGRRSGATGGKG